MKKKIPTQVLLVLFFGATMLGMSWKTPMWMDEYCFYRLSLELPSYSATADWFFKDRPEMLAPNVDWQSKGLDRETEFRLVYDTPIYPHTPLTVILMWPLVKGLNVLADYHVIPHIEDEPGYIVGAADNPVLNASMRAEFITNILRFVSIGLVSVSMWLIFKIMEKKVGLRTALLFALPIAASVNMLYGAFLFYWDVFMTFFFILTLYLMEIHPHSRWKYVTACCLVNTKMFIGIAFLFPLFVRAFCDDLKTGWKWPLPGWKMALPVISILPFYIATVVVTHEPLYIFTHYLAQVPLHNFIYTLNSFDDWIKIFFSLGLEWYLPMTLPIIFYFKKYPEYATLWILTMVYAWATGLGITHMASLVYSGGLVFPLLAHEWGLEGKIIGWLKIHNFTRKKEDGLA